MEKLPLSFCGLDFASIKKFTKRNVWIFSRRIFRMEWNKRRWFFTRIKPPVMLQSSCRNTWRIPSRYSFQIPSCPPPALSSPDLNVLDYSVWRLLRKRLNKYNHIASFKRLKELSQKKWKPIPQEAIQHTVDAWQSRVRLVAYSTGGHFGKKWFFLGSRRILHFSVISIGNVLCGWYRFWSLNCVSKIFPHLELKQKDLN